MYNLNNNRRMNNSKVTAVTLSLLMVASILFAAPSLAVAQQQQQTTTAQPTTAPPLQPLTLEEQEQLATLNQTIASITGNLEQGQKILGNTTVYRPSWSAPVWVEPDSLSIVFAYCRPGEYAESGQAIVDLGSVESKATYTVALTPELSG